MDKNLMISKQKLKAVLKISIVRGNETLSDPGVLN